MPLRLKNPDFTRYINSHHLEFHETTYNIFDEHKVIIDAPSLLAAYKDKVLQEAHVYQWLRKSEYTRKKADLDRQRGKTFRVFASSVRLLKKDFDPVISNEAKHLGVLIDNYKHIDRTSYSSETANLANLLERLASDNYRHTVEALKLTRWVVELTRINELFRDLVEETAAETVSRIAITLRAARKETIFAMRSLTSRVAALIDLNGEVGFEHLVKAFNVHVEHYNTFVHEHYGRLHATIDISNANTETIGPQRYTGQPINIIPVVTLRQKEKDDPIVRLVFTKDFTVGYRNNVGPGSARVFIYGIGKYSGETFAPFNIEIELTTT